MLAYLARDDAPNWLASHFRFQIRTFWLLVLFSIIGALLTMVLIGFLVLMRDRRMVDRPMREGVAAPGSP